ncbi:MAG: nitroreductase/quinone reductase family protein [Anaerolineales bacterium]
MPALTRNPAIKLIWSLHRWILQASGGRIGARIVGLPVLLLYTQGRKTGRLRINPLCYLRQDTAYIVVGSNGGADTHADWYLNLRAQQQVWIEVNGTRIDVKVRQLARAEAERNYQQFAKVYSGYARYKRRTKRHIPVIALEPVKTVSSER